VYCILERLASLEHRIVGGRDLERLLGARVQVGPRGPRLDREGTEADQVHRIAALEGRGDGVDHRVERAARVGLGQPRLVGDLVDQFTLVHWPVGHSVCGPTARLVGNRADRGATATTSGLRMKKLESAAFYALARSHTTLTLVRSAGPAP